MQLKEAAMAQSGFFREAHAKWISAMESVAGAPPTSGSWTGAGTIARTLSSFADAINHAHFPTGGGMDMDAVETSDEAGCIEIKTGGATYLCRPRALHLEVIAAHPEESFLLLELDKLKPTGVYEELYTSKGFSSEEVVDLGGGDYIERSHWDRGSYGYDENGDEKPLPLGARIVVRIIDGSILIVSKGTVWNGSSATYDGRHAKMAVPAIRASIEAALRTGRKIA
jgi:hypothetical protein